MTTKALVLGRRTMVVQDVSQRLGLPDVELYTGTGVDDVRATLARTAIDHVLIGAGLELDVRLEIVHEVFRASQITTVHMKDVASGPGGMLPFVRAVLSGLGTPNDGSGLRSRSTGSGPRKKDEKERDE